ncbi:hypothetical protein EIK77_008547 [Talaromyces pinophilus]|jgi:hypothetical protein|uniref:Uncharacterized protein n=1 Tax=Talaromyces pinophilus TaxID=128442 RepID=A0A6V8HJN1_TALPI|nr:hypothetical protein DPV78_009676 [Talaromyces pinophilus]KAI7974367.1 hypothetical protein EIK77_008547 [Talaromyces pinophilus]PCG91270.1 hypothetical protein PENOC_098220 [Penicillium occitanis (nom. inval.)]PCG93449.1 Hypothetical protein PENO1_083400 [Penicillium occitanis (nom. inval.)]GAM41488.1 hypothetical protein TCE0_042r14646 [Talaromyces pinophilus]
MWLARGVQSAIFYYATCTPCAEAENRRRRKKDAIRTQREQAKSAVIVTDQPQLFPQPTPFSTNAGWMEEIALGPGPPARRHRSKNCPSDGLPRLSSTSSMTVEGSVLSGGKEKATLSEKFHWSRFQREDEVLWGEEEEEDTIQGSSVGISGRARAGTGHSNKYYIARAPPVNDLHPPIVSGPTSRAETRWMLQPPPSAKVMAGKARHDVMRESRDSSIRRRSRIDMKIKESEEEEEMIQEGQLSPITDRPGWLINKATNSYRRTFDNSKKHRPAMLDIDTPLASPETGDGNRDTVRAPPAAATTIETPRSASMTNVRAYDEWHLQLSPSFHSRSSSPSSMGSPDDSLHWPDTPYSRPDSKRTAADSGKGFHPSYLNLAVSSREVDKSIEAIHLEVNEPRSREQMQPLKWRWSFDI